MPSAHLKEGEPVKFRLEGSIELFYPVIIDALYCPDPTEKREHLKAVEDIEEVNRTKAVARAKSIIRNWRAKYRDYQGLDVVELKIDALLVPLESGVKTWSYSRSNLRVRTWNSAVKSLCREGF